jgi:CO/xanthine dehydrogenase FAD-binding subunit
VALAAREPWTAGISELVDIKDLDAATGVSALRDTLRIGALVTADELASSAIVRREAPALAEAAAATSAPALRRRGTVGGNIITPHPAGDVVTALLALDATAEVIEGGITRDETLADLLSPQSNRRARSRLILAVEFRKCRQSAFEKLGSRAAFSRSIVSTCVVVRDGTLRVALGGLGERPFLSENAAIAAAEGRPMKQPRREQSRPPSDRWMSWSHRLQIADALIARALSRVRRP